MKKVYCKDCKNAKWTSTNKYLRMFLGCGIEDKPYIEDNPFERIELKQYKSYLKLNKNNNCKWYK